MTIKSLSSCVLKYYMNRLCATRVTCLGLNDNLHVKTRKGKRVRENAGEMVRKAEKTGRGMGKLRDSYDFLYAIFSVEWCQVGNALFMFAWRVQRNKFNRRQIAHVYRFVMLYM